MVSDPTSADPKRSSAAAAAEPDTAGDTVPQDDPQSSGGFGAATLGELRKVVWPSRQQLFSESVAVILMVGLSAASIAAIDRFYGWAASQVFR